MFDDFHAFAGLVCFKYFDDLYDLAVVDYVALLIVLLVFIALDCSVRLEGVDDCFDIFLMLSMHLIVFIVYMV